MIYTRLVKNMTFLVVLIALAAINFCMIGESSFLWLNLLSIFSAVSCCVVGCLQYSVVKDIAKDLDHRNFVSLCIVLHKSKKGGEKQQQDGNE